MLRLCKSKMTGKYSIPSKWREALVPTIGLIIPFYMRTHAKVYKNVVSCHMPNYVGDNSNGQHTVFIKINVT